MKSKSKTTAFDYILGIIGMALLALMLDMAIIGMTPHELFENIKCYLQEIKMKLSKDEKEIVLKILIAEAQGVEEGWIEASAIEYFNLTTAITKITGTLTEDGL